MKPLFFLCLLALACADIIIDIDVNYEKPLIDIRYRIQTNVITDVERKTFGLEDEALKKAVETYTKDSIKPDYVYVKKTGENNDLFAKFTDWLEVKRTVNPKYIKQDSVCSKNVTISQGHVTIKRTWGVERNLSIWDKVKHIVYTKDKNHTVESTWGQSGQYRSEPFNLSGYENIEVCTLTVTIDFEATVSGDVAVDYSKKRKDHHYWAYELKDVQNAANLPKSVIATETIVVTYYKMTAKPIPPTVSAKPNSLPTTTETPTTKTPTNKTP